MLVCDAGLIAVRISVVVAVDPTDPELLARIAESQGSRSIVDVVYSEVESNLESVSYVRHVSPLIHE